jgi:hypothetical protein
VKIVTRDQVGIYVEIAQRKGHILLSWDDIAALQAQKDPEDVVTDEEMYEIHVLFHKLWTAQVHADGYNKRDWGRLEELMTKLVNIPAGTVKGGGWLAKVQQRLGTVGMKKVQDRVRPDLVRR